MRHLRLPDISTPRPARKQSTRLRLIRRVEPPHSAKIPQTQSECPLGATLKEKEMTRLVLLFGIAVASMAIAAAAQCTGQPFGTSLGSFNGVAAYSNCYPTFDSNTENPAGTGLEWQCVEFVRRYYAQVYGAPLSKSNLGNANQWYNNYTQLGLERFANGGSTAPQPGDIITSAGPSGSNGHIGIASSVSSNQLCAVMQNWSEGASDINGSHCMSLTKSGSNYFVGPFDASGQYSIQGWLRWPGSTTSTPATMTYPPNGSTLSGSTVSFQWATGSGVQQCFLYVGDAVDSNDIYGQSEGTTTSATVTNLPTDGRTLYVTLWSYISGGWHANNYTYTAARIGVTPVPAAL